MKCSQCGNELKTDEKFCGMCGEKISQPKQNNIQKTDIKTSENKAINIINLLKSKRVLAVLIPAIVLIIVVFILLSKVVFLVSAWETLYEDIDMRVEFYSNKNAVLYTNNETWDMIWEKSAKNEFKLRYKEDLNNYIYAYYDSEYGVMELVIDEDMYEFEKIK